MPDLPSSAVPAPRNGDFPRLRHDEETAGRAGVSRARPDLTPVRRRNPRTAPSGTRRSRPEATWRPPRPEPARTRDRPARARAAPNDGSADRPDARPPGDRDAEPRQWASESWTVDRPATSAPLPGPPRRPPLPPGVTPSAHPSVDLQVAPHLLEPIFEG